MAKGYWVAVCMAAYVSIANGSQDLFLKAQEAYEKQNYIKALDAFYALAKKGDAKAQFNVALMYHQGKGAKSDLNEAKRWYEKSAKQGNAHAAYNLAHIYLQQARKGDVHGYKKARYWLEKALEGGVYEAGNNLGVLYWKGYGTAQDSTKALRYFVDAAKNGVAHANLNAGRLLAWGKKIERDKLKAYELLRKALKGGVSAASDDLDRLCRQSRWVCED